MQSQKRNIFFPLAYCSYLPSFTPFPQHFAMGKCKLDVKLNTQIFGGRKLKKTKTSAGRGAVLWLPVVLRLHQCLMRTMWRPPRAKAGHVPSAQPLGDTSFPQKNTWETSASAKPHPSRPPETEESPCA